MCNYTTIYILIFFTRYQKDYLLEYFASVLRVKRAYVLYYTISTQFSYYKIRSINRIDFKIINVRLVILII